VAPHERGAGLGTRLLDEAELPAGPLTAWSHGDHPAAAALAASHGWERVRELWVMRVDVADLPNEVPAPPAGVTVRGFRPDVPADAEELLRVNAAAFAHHPEQGGMDAANLAERMAEPWFDPEGLVMAWDGDRLAAFHWTKRHSAAEGEVYVVGVDPDTQGRGLGRLVTAVGLAHLRTGGATGIHLYVEGDNTPAVRLYEGLGFRRTQAHVQYARG
jgi:mycothiol synthase